MLDGPKGWNCQPAAAWRTGSQVARRPNDSPRRGDQRSNCPSLRSRRIVAAPRSPVLVPIVRRHDGHGLAFLRYHDKRHRRVEARAGTVRVGNRDPCLWRTQEVFTADAARADRDRDRVGLDGAALATASRLVAKVDSAAVQDGFQYLHGFIVTDDGHWVVVQQGMNGELKQARRCHWLSEGLKSFVDEPHAAIEGPGQGEIVNLTDHRAEPSRRRQLELLGALGPDGIARELSALEAIEAKGAPLSQPSLPDLNLAAHHDVRATDVNARRLYGNLAAAADRAPADFSDLLLTPGVGARTVQALAMVAEVVHGAPYRFTDPARFSFAHGGKDRHPFPVPVRVYDETIRVLKSAVERARLGREEELAALKRLDDQARRLERQATGPGVAELIGREREDSHAYGGRSVFGWEPPPGRIRSG